jgi:antitoxin HicB
MKTETTKDAAYYEGLPYTVTIRKDDEGDFVARIAELPGCIAHGENEALAIEHLRSVQRLWIEEALAAGNPIPEPEQHDELPSGKWIQRVPRRLHKELVNAARLENVSLNQLVTSMLSEALAVRNCTHAFDVFLARMPQPVHQMRDALIAMWWPGNPAEQASGWAIDPRPQTTNLGKTLARVRRIRSNEQVEIGEQRFIRHVKEEQLVGR